MISIRKCPRCGNTKSWRVRRGKRKCSACRYEWRESGLPLHLSVAEWKKLLRWFLLGLSSEVIAREANLGKGRVLRALILVREAMVRDIPPVFEGIVEIDETYLGGSWKNKRKSLVLRGVREEEERQNKQYLGFCAETARYGQK